MTKYLRELLGLHHFQHGLAEEKAKGCKMSRATYFRWVAKAEDAFMQAYKSAHTFAQSAADPVADDAGSEGPKTKRNRKKKRKQSTAESRASSSAQR